MPEVILSDYFYGDESEEFRQHRTKGEQNSKKYGKIGIWINR